MILLLTLLSIGYYNVMIMR